MPRSSSTCSTKAIGEHVLCRHATKAIFRDLSTSILLQALTGDSGGAVNTALEGMKRLGSLRYSREDERQADELGMELIRKARIDPSGMVQFFKVLQEKEARLGVLKYLSTHPGTAERVSHLSALAAGAGEEPLPVATPEEWAEAVSACLQP